MVQTDLSIPVPTGEVSQEDLTAANIEGMLSYFSLCSQIKLMVQTDLSTVIVLV